MNNNWKVLPFGEVCELVGGSQPPKSEFIYEPREGYIRLVQVRDYKTDKYETYIPTSKAKKFCNTTDIMIGRYGPPIFGIFSGIEGAYNVALMKAVPNESLLNRDYFRWFLKTHTLVRFVEKTSKRAAGQDGVRKERLYNYKVPIPPLEEQKQIVAILDEAFEAIGQAQDNIEKNIENAKELFQSKLNDIFSQKGESWEEKSLGEVGKVSMCKRIFKKQTTTEGDIPFYKIGTFGKQANAYITHELYTELKEKYSFPDKGDVLLSASGTIGRRVVYDGEPAYFQDSNIVWISNKEELILNEFLFEFYGYCDWNPSKGATISRLYNDDLRRIVINYPNKSIQKILIKDIQSLKRSINSIEHSYKHKLTNLEDLKKSLLEKAFAGELTHKDISV